VNTDPGVADGILRRRVTTEPQQVAGHGDEAPAYPCVRREDLPDSPLRIAHPRGGGIGRRPSRA